MLSEAIHRVCTDAIMGLNPTKNTATEIFTELLETVNHKLEEIYVEHKKTEVSLFLGLLVDNHLHFSIFWKEITGILVSEKDISDITVDMDAGEWHFVYDSHGDIQHDETLYIFSPKVDTHVIWSECKNLWHLSLSERTNLLVDRLERSYVEDAIIMSVGYEGQKDEKQHWHPEKVNKQKRVEVLFQSVEKMRVNSVEKIQGSFVKLSKETQNWVIISWILMSCILLYFIVSSIVQSQYTLFVPQKYRDMLADARVGLDDASRMIDQPENFGPAITRVRETIQTVKSANVLKVDVAELENQVAILEKAINKVSSLRPEDYKSVYTFTNVLSSLPFGIYTQDDKVTFVTPEKIIGPFAPGESPKEYPLPNNEKLTFADNDGEWKIYFWTDKDRVYTFEKGTFSIQNVQQVGGWDKAMDMSIYNSNIYLLWSDKRQIYKYRKQGENTYLGRSFVISDSQTKQIVDMDIDGSVWTLSGAWDTIKIEKILTAPKYERRPITINGLGINSFKEFNPDMTKIYAGESYQEFYLLADNRIWVFVPGSKRFNDVKFITYAGQLDIPNVVITDIAVEQEWDIRKIYFWSPKSGVFVTKMTIKDNKIHILPNQ